MAQRWWVGGTNTWNATLTGKWSTSSGGAAGAAVPTAADDVFFDAASAASTVTFATGIVSRSINCTGFTGTISNPASTILSLGDATAGASNIALKFVAGMTYTAGSTTTSNINFVSTSSTTQTIDYGGKTMVQTTINGAGSSYQLSSALTMNAASTLTLTAGTLDTNNLNHTWGSFSSSNSNTRTLTLGSSTITMTGITFDCTTSTNMTLNAGTSTLGWTSSTAVTPTIATPGLTLNDVLITKSAGGANVNGAGTATLHNFTMDNTVLGGGNRPLSLGITTMAITGTLKYYGASATNSGFLNSSATGTARTISLGASGAVDFNSVDFRDIAVTGTAAPVSGTRLGDGGNNSGITFPVSKNMYWVHSGGAGTISWNSTTNWSLTSGGASAGEIPLIHDYAYFNASSFTTSAQIVNMANLRSCGFDASAATNSPTFRFTNPSGGGNGHFGDLIFPTAGCTIDAVGAAGSATTITMLGRGSYSLNPNGASFGAAISFVLNGVGSTVTLGSNFTIPSDRTFTHTFGTFNANGYDVSTGLYSSNNSNTRALTMGSGTWTITGTSGNVINFSTPNNMTVNPGTATVNVSGAATTTRGLLGGGSTVAFPQTNVTAGTDTLTLNNYWCSNLNFTGFSGAVAPATNSCGVSGNFTVPATVTSFVGGVSINFVATSGTQTITTNGVTIDNPLVFNNAGATTTLAGNFTGTAARSWTLTAGTLDANNKNLSIGSFSSSNSNTRVINMGSGTWTLLGTGTIWNTATGTNLTLNAGTSTVIVSDTSATAKNIDRSSGAQPAASTFYNVQINGGTGLVSFRNANTSWMNNLSVLTPPANIRFNAPATYNFTGTLPSGTAGNIVTIDTNNPGVAATMSRASGIISSDYLSLKDSTATGGATWYAGANSTDVSGNTGWIFTAPPVPSISTGATMLLMGM